MIHPFSARFSSRRNSAFTLIELLVVIAIIAVLAAIIFPVFAQVRGNARKIACISNLKQIGLAMQMYASDNDGLLPIGKDASDDAVPQMWPAVCQTVLKQMSFLHPNKPSNGAGDPVKRPDVLPGLLDPYIKNLQVWKCPGDTGFKVLDNNSSCGGPCYMNASPTMYEAFGASYLFRTEIAFRQVNVDSMSAVSWDGKPTGPAEVNVIFDGNGSWHGSPLSWGNSGLRYNTLFADGHAKHLTQQQYQWAWATQITQGASLSDLCK